MQKAEEVTDNALTTLKQLDGRIKDLLAQLSQADKQLRQLQDLLLSYKDSAGMKLKLEQLLALLESDGPKIMQSIEKLEE
jgi:hypothetical protein